MGYDATHERIDPAHLAVRLSPLGLRKLVSTRMPEHVWMHRKRKLRTLPVRAIIFRYPAVVIGAARSIMNTNRLTISSRLRLRSAQLHTDTIDHVATDQTGLASTRQTTRRATPAPIR
jgi:hypothetical protein